MQWKRKVAKRITTLKINMKRRFMSNKIETFVRISDIVDAVINEIAKNCERYEQKQPELCNPNNEQKEPPKIDFDTHLALLRLIIEWGLMANAEKSKDILSSNAEMLFQCSREVYAIIGDLSDNDGDPE